MQNILFYHRLAASESLNIIKKANAPVTTVPTLQYNNLVPLPVNYINNFLIIPVKDLTNGRKSI
jgi:hypothetical protein